MKWLLYLNNLGVNESNTYLYIQGHHLFDLVVSPIGAERTAIPCATIRENEIRDRALHSEQAAPKWHAMRIVWAR